ncbi:MAG: serine protease [Tepidisphaeraceae bacterium]
MRQIANRLAFTLLLLNGLPAIAEPPATRPAAKTPVAPSWVAKDLTAWPPILLSNKITDTQKRYGYSGSAGLGKLPNGAVVLFTAGHLLGDTKPADFATAFQSWIATAPPTMNGGTKMSSIAMDVTQPAPLDVLVLLPASQQAGWPGVVLPVRQEPLAVGETVYLVAIAAEGTKVRQTVRKAEIAAIHDDGQFEYNVEGTFKTTGNSGAPVVDTLGRLAAINTGHLNDQTLPGKMQLTGVQMSSVLPLIKLPAGMKPLVLTTQPIAGPAAKTTGRASPAEEEKAERIFLATEFAIQQGMATAESSKGIYESIVRDFPNTQAAKKAQAKLDQMK